MNLRANECDVGRGISEVNPRFGITSFMCYLELTQKIPTPATVEGFPATVHHSAMNSDATTV